MTKAEVKKQILGLLLETLQNDDEALFGQQLFEQFEATPRLERSCFAARDELVTEFKKRIGS